MVDDETLQRIARSILRSVNDGVVGVHHAKIYAKAAIDEYEKILAERRDESSQ